MTASLAALVVLAVAVGELGLMLYGRFGDADAGPPSGDTRAIYVGTLQQHLLFVGALVTPAILLGLDLGALGLRVGFGGDLLTALGVALGLGVGLAAVGELVIAAVEAAGYDYDRTTREVLAPSGPREWAALLGAVLPSTSVFEELLFRGALVGVLSAVVGAPWVLVGVGAVTFGAIHYTGPAGVVGAGVLGLALGAAFVLTGSLLVVVVAHTVVNALEFVVHEAAVPAWQSRTPESVV